VSEEFAPPRRRVRVWFDRYAIGDFIGEAAYAERHEAAMRRRFPGCEVTNEPLAIRSGETRSAGPGRC